MPSVSVSLGWNVVSVPSSGVRRNTDPLVSLGPADSSILQSTPRTDQLVDEKCDCIKPTGYIDPHDPHDPVVRRRATMACRMGQTACLIDSKASVLKTECLDLLTTLDSCGGCTTEGQGTDCTLIPGVEDVSCEYGSCKVYSCERGFKVENGTACVPDIENNSVKKLVMNGLTGAESFWSH